MKTNPPRGTALLHNPLFNKGSAFSPEERRALGIEGLLPARQNTLDQQALRAYHIIQEAPTPLAKYRELVSLQDRNEHLFYRVLNDHLEEFMPIVYTPTVGEATQRFSDVFQRGRGIWITPEHRGRVESVLAAATEGRDIRLMVVTDNESVLGIGDQGAGGMAISIGKLSLYTAAAGIAPHCTLPVSIDVGTDNEALLHNERYLGLPQPRVRGEEYHALIDEFVAATGRLFPRALVQWEDFRKDNALAILDRHRHRIPSFNDDIQGTGAVTLAGLFGALRVTGDRLTDHRILIYGAGAAALGIARQIRAALAAEGLAPEQSLDDHIAVLDSGGLLVDDRELRDTYKYELAWPAAAATAQGIRPDGRGLADVVDQWKPTALIGTSGQAGSFTEQIVRSVARNADRPIVMPLSNPTPNAEAIPSDLLAWTDGRALIATGSPFEPVTVGSRRLEIGQGNNVFIFPALGMGALLSEAREVTEGMITRTAQALADRVTDQELQRGLLYPSISRLRDVTLAITAQVIDQAALDGVGTRPEGPLDEIVARAAWTPDYDDYLT